MQLRPFTYEKFEIKHILYKACNLHISGILYFFLIDVFTVEYW